MATSATGLAFLSESEQIFTANGEVLVEVCYPYAAGSKDFWLIFALPAFRELLNTLRPRCLVNIYRRYDLPLRGTVDEALMQAALKFIPIDAAYLILYLNPRKYMSSFVSDSSHTELKRELREEFGQQVAVGLEPEWGERYSNILYAVIPDVDGTTRFGSY